MLKLLLEIGLKPGGDLERWMSLARTIQNKRRASKHSNTRQITRSTALLAAAGINEVLTKLLRDSGLDWEKFQRAKGISLADIEFGTPGEDVDLHEHLAAVIREIPEMLPRVVEIDSQVLFVAIIRYTLKHPSQGTLHKRLTEAGFDLRSASAENLLLALNIFYEADSVLSRKEVEAESIIALELGSSNPQYPGKHLSAERVIYGFLFTKARSTEFDSVRQLFTEQRIDIAPAHYSSTVSQLEYRLSSGMAESLAIIRKTFPEKTGLYGALDLVTAALYAPEPLYPSFALSPETLPARWRSQTQKQWEAKFPIQIVAPQDAWREVFSRLQSRYEKFEHENPAYANEQRYLPKSGGEQGERRSSPQLFVESDSLAVIGRDTQDHGNRDSLNVKQQAETFATLLIAREVEPPFAIGLLGDWGVGKTFFMRLMQEKIDLTAGKNAAASIDTTSLSRVAQIEFNAWHFVDSDLWASLAAHIFDGLSRELQQRGDSVDDIRRELRRQINSSEREQMEARAAISEAQESRKQAVRELNALKVRRELHNEPYQAAQMKRVWDAVMRVRPGPQGSDSEGWPDLVEARDRAQEIARDLGLAKAIDTAESARTVLAQMQDIRARGSAFAVAVGAAFSGPRALLSGLLIAVVVTVAALMPSILDRIALLFGQDGETGQLLTTVMQVVTLLGTALGWVAKNLAKISSGLGYLEAIQRELDAPRVKLAEPSQHEKRLDRVLQAIDTRIVTEEQRIDESYRQISLAQAEIQRIDSGGLVYDFLEGRVRDSRYLDRLGLISVIRQDFEKLGELLRDWRTHGSQKGRQSAGEQAAGESRDNRPIERIVLYIDDLDRCPPERVVEVLQAVHLILAFKLFAVVVAVDPRWLERSLNEAYNSRLPIPDEATAGETQHRFSAQNYLEKIFQIPYSLPSMEDSGYRELVSNMVDEPKLRHAAKQDSAVKDEESGEQFMSEVDFKNSVPTVSTEEASTADEAGDTEASPEQNPRPADDSKTVEEQPSPDDAGVEVVLNESVQAETLRRIDAMLLSDGEKQFISALFPFIGTPRIAKRFVNVYRLLRVQVAQQYQSENSARKAETFADFVERDSGDYRAMLMLLAVNVGFADTGARILEDLGRIVSEKKGFQDWLLDAERAYQKARMNLHETRIEHNERSGHARPESEQEIYSKQLAQSALAIHQRVGLVIAELGNTGGPPFANDLSSYRRYAREVGRYSFGWHLTRQA